MSHSYNLLTLEEQADILGNNLPYSKLFEGKDIEGSNIRALLKGMSPEFMSLRFEVLKLTKELFLATSENQISEWEAEYGIPDDVFLGNGSLEERKTDIIAKLFIQNLVRKRNGDVSMQDFKDIAKLFGSDVSIDTGKSRGTFPLTFPIIFGDAKSLKFRIILNFGQRSGSNVFPLSFPFFFEVNKNDLLVRVLKKIKPANVVIQEVYNGELPPEPPSTILKFSDGSLAVLATGEYISFSENS